MYPALLFETLRKVMAEEVAYCNKEADGYSSDLHESLEKRSPEPKSLIMTGSN